jgi:hypothetical protein
MFGVFRVAKARKETVTALRRFIVRPENFAPWPLEFWRDPFVLGFFLAVIALIGRRAAGGKLTAKQRSHVMRRALEDIGCSPGFFDHAARYGSERHPAYLLGARKAQTVITYIQNLHPMPNNPDVDAATELAKSQALTGEPDRAEIGKALINSLFHDVVSHRLKLRWAIAEAAVRARLDEQMEAALSREASSKFKAAAHNEAANRKQ